MIERISAIVQKHRNDALLSLDELAHRSGVPVAVLAALEQGQPAITTTQLDDVAQALALDPVALLCGRELQRSTPSVFLRHASQQDFNASDGAALDEALEQARSLAGLRSLLGDPQRGLQAGIFVQREAAADHPDAPALEGYRLAREVRKWLGNTTEPLGDVRVLLEDEFGIAVVVRRLETIRVTAVMVRAETAAAAVLNALDPQRASNPLLARVYLAHELCHALFDVSSGGVHIVLDVVADRKLHAAEQRAGSFAAELLLPREGLLRAVGEPASASVSGTNAGLDLVERVRGRFGTPHEIAVNHLCNLGYIDHRLRSWLVANKTPFVGRPPETTLPDENSPSRLVTVLVERAHGGGLLTDGEARTTLGADRLAPLPWEAVEL